MCERELCPHCDPRGFLTAIARTVNIVENQGLTDEEIDERINYILKKRPVSV